jgi:predicted acetyltransferase
MVLRLVEPAPLYKAAILDAVPEMQASGEWDISPDAFAARFDDMLREIAAAKDPATAPPGVLAYEDFWLMEQDIWLGLLTLRCQINEQFLHSGGHIGYVVRPSKRRCGYGTMLLRLGLEKARERGLERVLLTCDETNIGSRKIIEANSGQLENAVVVAGQAVQKLRYWISLDQMTRQ